VTAKALFPDSILAPYREFTIEVEREGASRHRELLDSIREEASR